MGAQSKGPIAKPRTKRERPSVATSVLVLKPFMICWMPPE